MFSWLRQRAHKQESGADFLPAASPASLRMALRDLENRCQLTASPSLHLLAVYSTAELLNGVIGERDDLALGHPRHCYWAFVRTIAYHYVLLGDPKAADDALFDSLVGDLFWQPKEVLAALRKPWQQIFAAGRLDLIGLTIGNQVVRTLVNGEPDFARSSHVGARVLVATPRVLELLKSEINRLGSAK